MRDHSGTTRERTSHAHDVCHGLNARRARARLTPKICPLLNAHTLVVASRPSSSGIYAHATVLVFFVVCVLAFVGVTHLHARPKRMCVCVCGSRVSFEWVICCLEKVCRHACLVCARVSLIFCNVCVLLLRSSAQKPKSTRRTTMMGVCREKHEPCA